MEPTPLFLLVIPFAAGILSARQVYGLDAADRSWLFFAFVFCLYFFSTSLVLTSGKRGYIPGRRGLFYLLVSMLLVFSVGLLHQRFHQGLLVERSSLLSDLSERGGEFVFSGIVLKAPVPSASGCRTMVLVERLEGPGRAMQIHEPAALTLRDVSWRQIQPGAAIRFAATLRQVRNFRTPGSFDYENWWALRGIRIKAFSNSPLKLAVLSKDLRPNGLLHELSLELQKLRHHIMVTISSFFTGRDSRAVAMALLTGERAWFERQTREGFAASGLGHLLAVSGLHMALIAFIAAGIARFVMGLSSWALLNLNVRMISCWFAVAACLLYTAVAGFSPSSLRAFFIVLSLGLALVLEQNWNPKNATALAALILLCVSPFYLLDVSFQLSFYVVFFLIHFSEHLRFSGRPFWGKLAGLLLLSAASFLFASPLVAFYFQRFSLLAIPLNLLAIPLVEFLVLPCLLLGLLFSWIFPVVSGMFWQLADRGIAVLMGLVRISTADQWMHGHVLPPSVGQLCLITALFLVVPAVRVGKGFRKTAGALSIILIFTFLFHGYERTHHQDLILHLPDVGQGLCLVVEFPRGRVMVADAGGARSFDTGEMVVAPYLRRLGITRIDILALSHPELDHAGGIPSLLRQFQIGQIWINIDENPALSQWQEMLRIARQKKIPVVRWAEPSWYPVERDCRVMVLPCRDCPEHLSRNARCLVFRLDYRGQHILMTGDIDTWRERRLLSRHDVSARVMVIPHHGSRTSSSVRFLETVSPSVALCPVGYKNPFHLPSHVVMARYERLGIPVFRTDTDGTIDVRLSGSGSIRVSGYTGREREF